MQMIIEARFVDDLGETARVPMATIDRELTTDTLGMSLAEGKALLASAQQLMVRTQCEGIAIAHSACKQCSARLSVKGFHRRQIRTVFGRVEVRSPRVRHCRCNGKAAEASFSPLVGVVPTCVTPELEYLQVRWAAHLPFAAATALLSEVLPIADSISVSGIKRRVRVVGASLEPTTDNVAERRESVMTSGEPTSLAAFAVDSAWLKHCDPPRPQGRHVNLVAGRACFQGGRTRVYAYVHNQVSSAAAWLDQFLTASGVDANDRVTILTDGAGEFEKAVNGVSRPMCRILDWFHIAMKFRAIEQTAMKHMDLLAPNGRGLQEEIASCKWLTWHGKAGKAVARLKSIHDALGLVPENEFSTLHWNLRQTFWYLRSNSQYLVNYGRRHRKGLPISSGIAESAVNQIVSLRMAKKRQMRWSDEGAHLLAQVRVHELNSELRPRAVPLPWRPPKPMHDPDLDACLLRRAA